MFVWTHRLSGYIQIQELIDKKCRNKVPSLSMFRFFYFILYFKTAATQNGYCKIPIYERECFEVLNKMVWTSRKEQSYKSTTFYDAFEKYKFEFISKFFMTFQSFRLVFFFKLRDMT